MIEMIQENKNDILQNTVGFLKLSVQFSCSVVSDSLWPHESQHTRPPCPSPTPGVHPNSCASSRWCHPAISSSVVPFSSCPQSLPASGSFPMSQLFAWGGQSIGVSNCQENPRKKKNSVYLIKHIILLSKCQTPHLFRVKYILVKTEICSQVQSNLTLIGVDKWDHKLGWGWMGRSKSNFCKVIAC